MNKIVKIALMATCCVLYNHAEAVPGLISEEIDVDERLKQLKKLMGESVEILGLQKEIEGKSKEEIVVIIIEKIKNLIGSSKDHKELSSSHDKVLGFIFKVIAEFIDISDSEGLEPETRYTYRKDIALPLLDDLAKILGEKGQENIKTLRERASANIDGYTPLTAEKSPVHGSQQPENIGGKMNQQ
ncbi:MAG: hypothetical protein LBQ08_04160 [Holosporaceae bacterium]|jgi:hypothetical protein|nr:hypothetical protein [Holosporaceae bacterium]